MKKSFYLILSLVICFMFNSIVFAETIGEKDNKLNYVEYDENENPYIKQIFNDMKKVQNSEQLHNVLQKNGFKKEKTTKTTYYFYKKDGKYIKADYKKLSENGDIKYFIGDQEVNLKSFDMATSDISESDELNMYFSEYRGTEIDQYVLDRLNFVYEFDWNGSKIYQDLFGASWDDTDCYKTGVSYTSGLSSFYTSETSRATKVNASTNWGYINVMLKSRDGNPYNDQGSTTLQYNHATLYTPGWSVGAGTGFLNFSVSFNPRAWIDENIDDRTFDSWE